jgi:hypothetical protein
VFRGATDPDIIVLAGNVMMNIETIGSYEETQKTFIKNSGKALKTGGYIYLDFTLYNNQEDVFGPNKEERTIFECYDDTGVYGKYIICDGGGYDQDTQIAYGKRKIELVLKNGEKNVYEYISNKRIPKLTDIKEWLRETGFTIEQEYGNYNRLV